MAKVLQHDCRVILCVDRDNLEKGKLQIQSLKSTITDKIPLTSVGHMSIDILHYNEDVQRECKRMMEDYVHRGVALIELKVFADALNEPMDRSMFGEEFLWESLAELRNIATRHHITLLPEIHGYYVDKIYDDIARRGYLTYDLFFPGLLVDAIVKQRVEILALWIQEILDEGYRSVTRLQKFEEGWLSDIEGMVPEEDIQLIYHQTSSQFKGEKTYVGKDPYYFFSRVIQMFMPGVPLVYVDELQNIQDEQLRYEQWNLLRLRNNHPAFHAEAQITVEVPNKACLIVIWKYAGERCQLEADFERLTYKIKE